MLVQLRFGEETLYTHRQCELPVQLIAATLASNEEDTVVTDDGRLVCGHEAYNRFPG